MARCPTCGKKQSRSTEANRRYWALLNEVAERVTPQGQQYTAETWHEYFKQRFLGVEEILLPNGKTIQRAHTTTLLDVSEFNDFMTQVEAWAANRGVYLDE